MQDSFNIKQNLSLTDFISSALYYYLSGRRLRLFIVILMGFNFLKMLLDLSIMSKTFKFRDILFIFVPGAIVLLIVITVVSLISLYTYKSNPYFFENVSYDFTHWGITRHGERGEFSKPWRDVTKLKESKGFFLFNLGVTEFHIIQKKMFTDEKELDNFRQLLNEKLKT